MAGASSLPGLPALFEFAAEPEWRCIEFISDLHLAADTPRTTARWARFLDETTADMVFILGDLFEVWIGDDARTPGSFAADAANVLADASRRRRLAFMAGNRDFLVGAELLRDGGMTALPDPTLLDAWGRRVLLTHGDALCLDDVAYQAFRTEVRSQAWRAAFLARPLAEREQLARAMRDASEASKRAQTTWADVDAAAAVTWMRATDSREMVHGHTHRAGSSVLAPGFTRHVLSDWDCDREPARAQVLRLTRDGFARFDLAP
jgi:UDP-2,3-diacylglucosamine hydrolase